MKVRCIYLTQSLGVDGLFVGEEYEVLNILSDGGTVEIIDSDGKNNVLFSREYEFIQE